MVIARGVARLASGTSSGASPMSAGTSPLGTPPSVSEMVIAISLKGTKPSEVGRVAFAGPRAVPAPRQAVGTAYIENGELVVVCDSTAWATQMRLLAPTLVRRLNDALRRGRYADDVWVSLTGKSLSELADEWRRSLRR